MTNKKELKAFLVLESGEVFDGRWLGGKPKAGELVFNTSHSGYEEIATDPSYFNQIVLLTAPMMGNYGARKEWESEKLYIQGFCALEIQNSPLDKSWINSLSGAGIPVVDSLDTRRIVFQIRKLGTPWAALLPANNLEEAKRLGADLIRSSKKTESDWVYLVSKKELIVEKGSLSRGPRVALLDYGYKKNILNELKSRSSEVAIFSSRATDIEIKNWNPDGILLSNGPGDPKDVKVAVETLRSLLGWKPIFGICMGHQILSIALGAKTFKMPFGHRGSNHPVKDSLLDKIYMTSQNHGYSVDPTTLDAGVKITHENLYDKTVEGIVCESKKCFSVQFHPENRPGPRDSVKLFDYFKDRLV